MSPRAAAEFGKQWPVLQRRLNAFLRGKGVPPSEIDDLVQEVAARLVSFWHKVDPDRPLWPLTVTIALNLVRDRGRRPDLELLGELPEVAGSTDVADASIARLELAAVVRAMDALTSSQKAALLQTVAPDDESVPSTSAEKMLRMRARRRLANAVGRVGGGLALRTRRLTDSLQGFFAKADSVAQALACATCVLAASAGSAILYPGFQAYEEAGSPRVVTEVQQHALVSRDANVASNGSGALSSEVLSPSRASGSRSSASGVKGQALSTGAKGSSGSAGSASSPVQNLPIPEPPGVPPQPPVPAAPDAPSAPPTPDQPAEASDVGQGPVQAPQGDAPLNPVEEVTTLLGKVKR